MANIQEIFNRIEDLKNKQKEIKTMYRDALANSFEYNEVTDKLKKLKEKKKEIESGIKSDFTSELDKLNRIKVDLESDNVMLSDIALNHILKGQSIEITDEYDNKYEPLFSVKFKKI